MSDPAEPTICYVAVHSASQRRYVGITTQTLKARISAHISQAHKTNPQKTFFHLALHTYGREAFTWKKLADGRRDVMAFLESALIQLWNTHFPEKGFNGKGGANWLTEEPLTKDSKYFTYLHTNVDILHMLNDLSTYASWFEKNSFHPDHGNDLRDIAHQFLAIANSKDPNS